MLRRLGVIFLGYVVVFGCSSTETLGATGALCDEDVQCQQPLICACVKRRSPDAEGDDQIIEHGRCSPRGTKCVDSDAGTDARTDTATDAPQDSATDAPQDSATEASGADAPADGG